MRVIKQRLKELNVGYAYLTLMPGRRWSSCACCRALVDAAAFRSNPRMPSNGVSRTRLD